MLFYFTGTGNSKFIADGIAAKIGERVLDISDCMRKEQFAFSLEREERLGFVSPVYYFGLPIIVVDFLKKLNLSTNQSHYTYVILNCGGATGNAERQIPKAYKPDAVFGLVTVDNYVPMYKVVSDAEIKEQLDKAEQAMGGIVERIQNRETGTFNPVKGSMAGLLTLLAYSLYKHGRKTRKFHTNENCTGCGLCEKGCPREVITLENNKPVWKAGRCEQCLGCLHRCPTAAINYGKKTAGRGRYVNPRTKF